MAKKIIKPTPADASGEGPRIALVTGANRGLGFEIARQLARRGLKVLLASRTLAKGRAAAKLLAVEGLDVEPVRLDVTDPDQIKTLARDLRTRLAGLDVLVNNAGVLLDPRGGRFLDSRQATYERTLATNVLGPLMLCQAVLPMMIERGYGRIVNLSSGLGQLDEMGSGTPAYRISKTALNALTRIVASDTRGSGVLVNSVCPGWVRTEMGGAEAPRTVAQGADTAVWLATLPGDGPSGGFFRDRKQIPW
ncbi:MAG: SDR family oxidoreductase [Rhodocyclaceae bacterium]|jgi:NAD(P)-dependent dehydrogenase (short-subunit alcohol dehydrogenase family)|nr:SDR family oxidoreductase [Rhodocyclaceae bacterium]MCA3073043.1 SDR family oxidoreductase [Rhodocyclaceae bacterium]MCA3088681.1 SDR family oxidoreductase [Rhodocyclaceae bacterium]MCA3092535.1 SDR family oxidoreductase [Rhodocyclaceae bacterium]MCA3098678.1 SDR family oxidoreductase [Rhodocyclaceae bacterium]